MKSNTNVNNTIEQMTLAICNSIREQHNLPPITNMKTVENPEFYRKQARAVYEVLTADKRSIEVQAFFRDIAEEPSLVKAPDPSDHQAMIVLAGMLFGYANRARHIWRRLQKENNDDK